jgi:hypothetical protein
MGQLEPIQIYVDNQAVISIANNLISCGRNKRFKIKLYFLKEVQKEGEVTLLYCRTNDQIADVLTKALSKASFEELRSKLSFCSS